MNIIPEKINAFTAYTPSTGVYDIRMDANESPFPMPKKILNEFFREAEKADLNRYPDAYATELCASFAKRFGLNIENTVAGNGSDELISVITSAFTEHGDKVAVSEPDFSMYSFYSELNQNEVCVFRKNEDFSLDLKRFSAFVNENECKMVLLSNPCNPTGCGNNAEDILRFAENTKALVIIDEAYMEFWDESVINKAAEYENIIVLKTLSKCFGAAGVRVGFAVGNKTLIDVIKTVKSPYNVNTLSQIFGRVTLDNAEVAFENRRIIVSNAKKLENFFSAIANKGFSVYHTNTNFVLVRTERADYYFEELKKRGILVRKLGDALLRITACNDGETDSFIRELEGLL